nr:M15 family metallopeptidase [Spirulina major]
MPDKAHASGLTVVFLVPEQVFVPKQSQKSLLGSMDDIPIAQRDLPNSSPRRSPWLIGVGVVLGGGAIAAGLIFWISQQPQPTVTAPDSVESPAAPPPVENILGHLPYEEANPEELTAITADGSIRLRSAAAQRWIEMVDAARQEGITLAALSGYRTAEEQDYLFFEVKEQRNQPPSERAEVSAPPGFSEHHTGYAIDIGDGNDPSSYLTVEFENTPAFQWLATNAARFGFELSFPPDNPQGIAYEPWHWRFVGDSDSLETFYRAQNLPQSPASP